MRAVVDLDFIASICSFGMKGMNSGCISGEKQFYQYYEQAWLA
jgi:hypothetical protein